MAEPYSMSSDAPPTTGKSLSAKMIDTVRNRPGVALALIVVLALVVLFFYAQKRDWFGLGGGKASLRAAPRGRNSAKSKKARAADDVEDPETEDLIDSINGSG